MTLWELMHLETWCIDMVITRRAHCSHDCIYIMPMLLLWDLSSLSIVDHLWPLIYKSFHWIQYEILMLFFFRKGRRQYIYVLPICMYLFNSWPVCAKILKHIFSAGPELWHIWLNMAHLPWNKLFWKKLVIWFWPTSWPLSLCTSFFKKSWSGSRLLMIHHFLTQLAKQYFFQKNNLIFIYIWVHSIS